MAEERWYPTVTPLQNGEMLITDGVSFRADAPEVRETDGAFRSLTNASVDLGSIRGSTSRPTEGRSCPVPTPRCAAWIPREPATGIPKGRAETP